MVRAGNRRFLVDAGRGVCMRMAAAGTLPIMLHEVLLTHLHSDHVCGLNDVVTTHWVMSRHPTTLGVGAGGDGRRGTGHAGARRRLPPGPPRRSDLGSRRRGPRAGTRRRPGRRRGPHRRGGERPPAGRADPRLPVRARRRLDRGGRRQSPAPGSTTSVSVPTSTSRRCSATTWSASSRCSGSWTRSTTTPPSSRPPRPRPGPG
ncbi:MAG: MBL fold metallo-hydrolase [Acidimicrobiales bacterium]